MISGVGSALDHVIVLVDAKAPRALDSAPLIIHMSCVQVDVNHRQAAVEARVSLT